MANQRNPIGVDESENSIEFNIYPVPARTSIYLDINFTGEIEYSINDANGRIVEVGRINSTPNNNYEIRLKNMPQGFYILNLRSGNAELGRRKFILE